MSANYGADGPPTDPADIWGGREKPSTKARVNAWRAAHPGLTITDHINHLRVLKRMAESIKRTTK